MNKSKIEWCDYTWNPVTGCLHGCEYCYAKKIDKRFGDGKFTPTFHPVRLLEPLKVKKPSRIFVGSVSDLFGDWNWKVDYGVEGEWYGRNFVINEVITVTKQCPQHTFIFLTKNPKGMQGFDFPPNCWCGTSVENQEKADDRIPELLRVNCKIKFVSLEPILGPVDLTSIPIMNNGAIHRCDALKGYGGWGDYDRTKYRINWLIIGAQTGPGAVRPKMDWLLIAEDAKKAGIPVFIKDNAADCYRGELLFREYPGV